MLSKRWQDILILIFNLLCLPADFAWRFVKPLGKQPAKQRIIGKAVFFQKCADGTVRQDKIVIQFTHSVIVEIFQIGHPGGLPEEAAEIVLLQVQH